MTTRFFTTAATILVLALTTGCDSLLDLADPSSGDTSTSTSTPAPASPASPTTAAAPSPAPAPAIDVSLDVGLRTLVVGGNLYVEANFNWAARSTADVVVDIQIKSDLTYPQWTDLLTDQSPVDVATQGLQGPRQRFHFRAVAQDLNNPDNVAYSDIVTIGP